MRLIDADIIEKMFDGGTWQGDMMITITRDLPTAYDVEKVIEQIKEQDGICTGCRHTDECNECSIGEKITIVKGGGIDEN